MFVSPPNWEWLRSAIDSRVHYGAMRKALYATSIGLAICGLAFAADVITLGKHEGETKVDVRGPWLALRVLRDGWRLEEAKLTVNSVDGVCAESAVSVSADVPDTLVFLSASTLKVGPVMSAQEHGSKLEPFGEMFSPPKSGASKTLTLGERHYTLRNVDGRVSLSFNSDSQYLFDYREDSDVSARVWWIGDLDGDGKLDLIADTTDKASQLRLYLSGSAKVGSLVKLVAVRGTPDC